MLRKRPPRRTHGRWFAGGREDAHTPERESPLANRGPDRRADAVYRSCGEGGLTGTVGASRGVDVSHQTVAKPETRRDSAEPGKCDSSCLS
ncbi:hypothetical protein JFK57_17075 [Escherichia coli]|nr:hypothetical protein [Escherichia coli]